MHQVARYWYCSNKSPLVWYRTLPLSWRRWIKRQLHACIWAIVLLPVIMLLAYVLDQKDIPWKLASEADAIFGGTTFFTGCHAWLHHFTNEWGDLVTFLIGFIIGLLIPSRAEKQTEQILQFIRGNLLDFESVYTQVCELLEDMHKDELSCFVMVTQSPLLGADVYPENDNRFYRLMMGRVTRHNRVVCLSPYSAISEDVDPNNSPLRKFYDDLARYNPTKRGSMISRQTERPAASMFAEAAEFVRALAAKRETDVVFASSIPYQVFLGRKSSGERTCILLLNGWDAIKKHLPSGGFVSQDPTFLQLIEESIQILLGTDRTVYEIRHAHTKRILKDCCDYAGSLGSPLTPQDVAPLHNRLKKVRFGGADLSVYPYVFDPAISESGSIMGEVSARVIESAKALHQATDAQPLQVWDIGCGSGALSVMAARSKAVRVLALDVNAFAVECTRHNAAQNGVAGEVTPTLNASTVPAEVFKPCAGKKADVILADLPFLNCHPYARDPRHTMLQMAYLDHGQALNIEVLKQAKDYLNPDGRLIVSFSDLDSVPEFREQIELNGWSVVDNSDRPQHKNNHDWYAFVLARK